MDHEPDPSGEKSTPRRPMTFRRRSKFAPPTSEQSRRQSDVVQSAWRRFGERGPAIAFLNSRNQTLEGNPLHLAIESDEGLARVESLLQRTMLQA
jgi:hypothetical protein